MSVLTQERWVVKDGPLGTYYVHDRLTGRDHGRFTTPRAARDWITRERDRYIAAVENHVCMDE